MPHELIPMPISMIHDLAFPTSIYKYTKRKYAEAMCQSGELRLAGLESYPDRDEGKRFVGIDHVSYGDIHGDGQHANAIKNNLARIINVAPSAHGFKMDGCQITWRSGNWPVYCTSTRLSSETMQSCNFEQAQYDACVEVFDVGRFVFLLDQAVRQLATNNSECVCIAGSVKYEARGQSVRTVPKTFEFERAFIKPPKPKYMNEHEYRVVWCFELSCDQTLSIKCPEITSVCRLRDL